ncbi:hypothetical protein ABZ401_12870 [Streptomyces sp. NPDC005892]|uniref:hypothetical protein n=1 Tax=Streptomyces sp. NPDC005892 TaxID=3155593 RepID=UPI0033FBCFFD
MNRETFDCLLDLTANPFIPELHHDDCDDESCVRCIAPADADVNANVGWHFGPDGRQVPGMVRNAPWQPDGWIGHFDAHAVQHPGDLADCTDCQSVGQSIAARIAAGIAAEQRHLLYDADPDSTVPALVNLHHTPRRRTR